MLEIDAYAAFRLKELERVFDAVDGGDFFGGPDLPTDSAGVGKFPEIADGGCASLALDFAITALSLAAFAGGPFTADSPTALGVGGPFSGGACATVSPWLPVAFPAVPAFDKAEDGTEGGGIADDSASLAVEEVAVDEVPFAGVMLLGALSGCQQTGRRNHRWGLSAMP